MDGLELRVQEPGAHECGRSVGSVEVGLESAEQLGENVRRRRHVDRIPRATTADPVLAAPNLARQLLSAAYATHEAPMGLVEEAHRQREPVGVRKLRPRIAESVEIVADLFDISGRLNRVSRPADRVLLGLEGQEIRERRLRSFDLGGEDGFLANEGVDEPIERRHHFPRQLEPNERRLGRPQPRG